MDQLVNWLFCDVNIVSYVLSGIIIDMIIPGGKEIPTIPIKLLISYSNIVCNMRYLPRHKMTKWFVIFGVIRISTKQA